MSIATQEIAIRYKGTHDIAGVAQALYNSASRPEFIWTNDSGEIMAPSIARLLQARRINCYEFVHFCAYLCGIQRTAGGTNLPWLSPTAGTVMACSQGAYDVLDGKEISNLKSISKGAIVAGVAKKGNNNLTGYIHVGIAVSGSGTEIISLAGGHNLWRDRVNEVFPFSSFWGNEYKELWIGRYHWQGAQFDSYLAQRTFWSLKADSDWTPRREMEDRIPFRADPSSFRSR